MGMGGGSRPENGSNFSMINKLNYYGNNMMQPDVGNVGLSPNQYPGGGSPMPRPQMTPNQFMSPGAPQGLSMGPTPSPGSMGIPGQVPQNQGYGNSPGSASAMMHSPAGPGMNVNNLRPYHNQMVPSPGTSINTPQMTAPTPSPRNPEDQACFDKIKELRKYTDLLQRMIAKIGNDDVEKSSKMKKLLEILTNPSQRVSMEILLKCEIALKRMERQHDAGGGSAGGSMGPASQQAQSQPTPGKEQTSPFQQLLDAAISTSKYPSASHTFKRTFQPALDALHGTGFRVDGWNGTEEEAMDEDYEAEFQSKDEIPWVLTKEIDLLNPNVFRMEVIRQGENSEIWNVTCRLVEKSLPSVPPLKFEIHSGYPDVSPQGYDFEHYFGSTDLFSMIGRSLKDRMRYFQATYTVTELLNTWEMCVRQACHVLELK